MKFSKTRFSTLLVCFFLIAFISPQHIFSEGDASVLEFTPVIQSDPRISFGKGITEEVSPISGSLNVTYTDVSLQGKGLPLVINHNYNSSGVPVFSEQQLGSGMFGHIAYIQNLSFDSFVGGMLYTKYGATSYISEGMLEEAFSWLVGLIPGVSQEVVSGILNLVNIDYIDNTNAHLFMPQWQPCVGGVRGVVGSIRQAGSLDFAQSDKYVKHPIDNISVIMSDGSTVPFTRNTFSDIYQPKFPNVMTKLEWDPAEEHYIFYAKDGTRYYIEPFSNPILYVGGGSLDINLIKNLFSKGALMDELVQVAGSGVVNLYVLPYGLIKQIKDRHDNKIEIHYEGDALWGPKRISSVVDTLGREVTFEYSDPINSHTPFSLSEIAVCGKTAVLYEYPGSDWEDPLWIRMKKPINDTDYQEVQINFKDPGDTDHFLEGEFYYINRIEYATGGYVEYFANPLDNDYYNHYFYRDTDLTNEFVHRREEHTGGANDLVNITRFDYSYDESNHMILTGSLFFNISSFKFSGGLYGQLVKKVTDWRATVTDHEGHITRYTNTKNKEHNYNHNVLSVGLGISGLSIIDFPTLDLGFHPSTTFLTKIEEGLEDPATKITTENTYDIGDELILFQEANIYDSCGTWNLLKTTVTREMFTYTTRYTEFDEYGNVKRTIDPLEHETYIEYLHESNPTYADEGLRSLVSLVQQLQNKDDPLTLMETRYYYDLALPTSDGDVTSGTSGYVRGELNQMREDNPDDATDEIIKKMVYSDQGLVTLIEDALGNETEFSYDFNYDSGTKIKHLSLDAMDIKKEELFDFTTYNLLKSIDGKDNYAEYTYDGLNRVTMIEYPESATLEYLYHDVKEDLWVEVRNALQDDRNNSKYYYDGLGRLEKFEQLFDDDEGVSQTYTSYNNYNPVGLLESTVDAQGRTTRLIYDKFQRLRKIIYPDETSVEAEYNYDKSSVYYEQYLINAKQKKENKKTIYRFNKLGQMTYVLDAAGIDANYTYDAAGNMKSMTDPRKITNDYFYDTLNRLNEIRYQNGTHQALTYDKMGNITAKSVYMYLHDGSPETEDEIEYEYDNKYRLIRTDYPDGAAVTYDYDDNSNMIGIYEMDSGADPSSTINTYDNMGRLKTSTRNNKEFWDHDLVSEHVYNSVNDLTKIRYPSLEEVNYIVDTLHRTTNIWLKSDGDPADGKIPLASYEYDPIGTINTVSFQNGVLGEYQYNDLGHMDNLEYFKGDTSLLKHDYDYDIIGNRSRLTENDIKETEYTYDDINRLTRVKHLEKDGSNNMYTYDESGNRTMFNHDNGHVEYIYADDSNNLLEIITNDSGHSYCTYDSNGNLVREEHWQGESGDEGSEMLKEVRYHWDCEDRLKKVEHIDPQVVQKTNTVLFKYDAAGRRIYKESKNGKIAYVYVSGFIGEEYTENAGIWELSAMHVFGNDKRICSLDSDSGKNFFQDDVLGSSSLVTDQFGNKSTLTKYDEFGNISYQWSKESDSKGENLIKSYGFTGKPRDDETGLSYFGARYYNPLWGRWIGRDPLTGVMNDTQTLNRWIYVSNNPLRFIDPHGLEQAVVARPTYIFFKHSMQIEYDIIGGEYVINRISSLKGKILWQKPKFMSVEFTKIGTLVLNDLGEYGVSNDEGELVTSKFHTKEWEAATVFLSELKKLETGGKSYEDKKMIEAGKGIHGYKDDSHSDEEWVANFENAESLSDAGKIPSYSALIGANSNTAIAFLRAKMGVESLHLPMAVGQSYRGFVYGLRIGPYILFNFDIERAEAWEKYWKY